MQVYTVYTGRILDTLFSEPQTTNWNEFSAVKKTSAKLLGCLGLRKLFCSLGLVIWTWNDDKWGTNWLFPVRLVVFLRRALQGKTYLLGPLPDQCHMQWVLQTLLHRQGTLLLIVQVDFTGLCQAFCLISLPLKLAHCLESTPM